MARLNSIIEAAEQGNLQGVIQIATEDLEKQATRKKKADKKAKKSLFAKIINNSKP